MSGNIKKTMLLNLKVDLDSKEAQQNIKALSKEALLLTSQFNKSGNSMAVFKNLISFVSQLDSEMNSFRNKHEDDFKRIFGSIDNTLLKQMQDIFGNTKEQLAQINVLREKISAARSNKDLSMDEAKAIEQEVRALYAAMGKKSDMPLSAAKKPQNVLSHTEKVLDKFIIKWESVNDRIAKGFDFGTGGTSTGLENLSQEVQAEVNRIQKEIDELEAAKDKYNNIMSKWQESKASKKDMVYVDEFKPDTSIEGVQKLISEIDTLQQEIKTAEAGTVEYYNTLNKLGEASIRLENSRKAILKDDDLKNQFRGIDKSDPNYGFSESHGVNKLGEMRSYAITQPEQIFKSVKSIDKFIEAKRKEIEVVKEANIAHNQESLSDNNYNQIAEDVKKTSSEYDTLTKKVKEYKKVKQQIEDKPTSDQELKDLKGDAEDLEVQIAELSKAGDKASEVVDRLQAVDITKLDSDENLAKLSNILGIEIPQDAKKTEGAFAQITQEINKVGNAAQKVMYHVGNLFSSKGSKRDVFEDMPYNLTEAVEGNKKYEQYGYGALGGGLFGVTDPSTISQEPVGASLIHSIDLSKYNMYMANTEERATALIDFLSKLQKFAMKGAEPNYKGFDEQLKDIDVSALYQQFQTLFAQSDLTKDQFDNFINQMTSLLKQAGLKFNAEDNYLDFTSIGNLEGTDNISTRFMKMLGYDGINVGTTSFDGLGQGSVLFDFKQSDIVGYFNDIKSAVKDYQNIVSQIDGKEWVGTSEQLEQYKININEIIARLQEARKLQLNRGYKESSGTIKDIDNALSELTQVKATIDQIAYGSEKTTKFARVTDDDSKSSSNVADIQKEAAAAEKAADALHELNNESDKVGSNTGDIDKIESALEDVEAQAKQTDAALENIGSDGSKSVDDLRQMYDTLKAAHDALPRQKTEEPDYYTYDWSKAKDYVDFEYNGEDSVGYIADFNERLKAERELLDKNREAIKSTYKQIREMQNAVNKHGGHLGDDIYNEQDIENAKHGLMGLFEMYDENGGDLDALDMKMTKPFQTLLETTKAGIAARKAQQEAYDAETKDIIANNREQIESFEKLYNTTRDAFEASKSKDKKYDYAWANLPQVYGDLDYGKYSVGTHYDSFEANLKRLGIEVPQAAEKAAQAQQELKSEVEQTTNAIKEQINIEQRLDNIDTTTDDSIEKETAAVEKQTTAYKELEAAKKDADHQNVNDKDQIPDTEASSEIQQLERLEVKVKEVTAAIEAKTAAFTAEGTEVNSVVQKEIADLERLIGKLKEVESKLDAIKTGLKGVDDVVENVDSKIDDDSVKDTSTPSESVPDRADNKYALDSTLSTTNSILQGILTAVSGDESTGQVAEALDGAITELKAAASALKANADDFKQKAKDDAKDTSKDTSTDSKKERTFDEIKSDEISSFEKYRKDAESSIHVTDEFKSRLAALQLELDNVGDVNGLNAWRQNFGEFQSEFSRYEDASKKVLTGQINAIKKEAKDAMKGLDLDLPTDDPEKRAQQEAIAQGFKEIQIASEMCASQVKSNQNAEISALNATKQQLLENINTYKKQYGLLNSGGKSGKNYGNTAIIRETTRYNQFQQYANDDNAGFKNSGAFNSKLQEYTNAYNRLIAVRERLASKPVLTDRDVQEFNDAKQAAANYGKELDKMIAKSNKLASNKFQVGDIGSDINVDDALSRKQALTDFVTGMHDARESTIKFSNDYQECMFKMKNSDGTWTKMTATLDKTSNKMYSTAGEVTKYGTAIGEFAGALKGEFLKLGRYMIASFGIEEVIQVVRTGITYVKEIDDALTDLKKVTNETEGGYDRFLQTMSKTAGVVGSTVAELTTMAAEWARLKYLGPLYGDI